jgi:hypothetical protein
MVWCAAHLESSELLALRRELLEGASLRTPRCPWRKLLALIALWPVDDLLSTRKPDARAGHLLDARRVLTQELVARHHRYEGDLSSSVSHWARFRVFML